MSHLCFAGMIFASVDNTFSFVTNKRVHEALYLRFKLPLVLGLSLLHVSPVPCLLLQQHVSVSLPQQSGLPTSFLPLLHPEALHHQPQLCF